MEKQSRVEAILSVMRTKLETYIDEESLIDDPKEHLLDIGQQFSLEVLNSSIEVI